MQFKQRLSLFLLRITVFLVMFMWSLDKFIRPDHASTIFQTFYYLPAIGAFVMYLVGAIEMLIIFCFLLGIKKTWSYGAVFVLHLISTLSSYQQMLAPFDGVNLLFFAAWPMLAGCLALFLLRHEDRILSLNR